jgi:hypothetical protein
MSMSLFEKFLYFLCFPLVCIGSVLSPLTNDVRIFYGVEYLCWKYIPDFPSNINYFFEIKPIMNHIVNYFLVVVTNFFIPFENHFTQEILIKAIAVTIAIVACWLFSRNVLKIRYGFMLCFTGTMCALNLNVLQAEWWSLCLVMIAAALLVEENKWLHYLSGTLLMFAFLTKGTTISLVISGLCALIVLNYIIDWKRVIFGFIGTGGLFLVANFTIWKSLISDIMLAPMLSHVGEYSMLGQAGVIAIATIIAVSIYIPCAGIGGTYGLVWAKNHLKDPRIYAFGLMWGIVFFVTWLQNESFAYQFYPFILPAIISLILFEKETPRVRPGKKFKRENIVAATIVLLFGMYCIFYAPVISYYGSQEKTMNDFFWEKSNEINKQFDLPNQTSVVYLDTGSGPYYFSANSTCKYPAPLILQRANPNRTFILDLPQNHEEFLCVMNSESKYIVADGPIGPEDSWFGNDTYQKAAIIQKLRNEYIILHSGGWEIYIKKNKIDILNLA